ncbi:hypothetical protein N9J72_01965 [Candidatus Gracilibacteria bacterium]|nr:hypothetical protein [Candidatus Gracilibacteria bacterium]
MQLIDRKEWEQNNPKDKGASNCPFCDQENPKNEQLTVWKGKYWFICHNKYPILGLRNIMMAIPYRHAILSSDLSEDEYKEFRDVEIFMKSFYGDQEYFVFMRESVAGRSLEHIHYHFVPGRIPYDDIEVMLKKQGY